MRAWPSSSPRHAHRKREQADVACRVGLDALAVDTFATVAPAAGVRGTIAAREAVDTKPSLPRQPGRDLPALRWTAGPAKPAFYRG
jgi:hypothetical protein